MIFRQKIPNPKSIGRKACADDAQAGKIFVVAQRLRPQNKRPQNQIAQGGTLRDNMAQIGIADFINFRFPSGNRVNIRRSARQIRQIAGKFARLVRQNRLRFPG